MSKYQVGDKVIYTGKLKTYKGRVARIVGKLNFNTEKEERYYVRYLTGKNPIYPSIVTLKEIKRATKADLDKINKKRKQKQ